MDSEFDSLLNFLTNISKERELLDAKVVDISKITSQIAKFKEKLLESEEEKKCLQIELNRAKETEKAALEVTKETTIQLEKALLVKNYLAVELARAKTALSEIRNAIGETNFTAEKH